MNLTTAKIPSSFEKCLNKKLRNRIHRVGLELEGGWSAFPVGLDRLVHDGSVHFQSTVVAEKKLRHVGEVNSKPMAPSQIDRWLEVNYPSAVNETCGMHVHMSFPTAILYQRLMTPDYPLSVIEAFKKWASDRRSIFPDSHPIWGRLYGNNIYCTHDFHADVQARMKDKRDPRRRTAINYCFPLHNTAECRLLPMMPSPLIASEAVKHLLQVTNAFFVATAKREIPVVSSIIIDEGLCTEEITERITRRED